MMHRLLIGTLSLMAASAWAAGVQCPSGTLTPTAQTATGGSANTLTARGAPALVFQATATGTATVQIEISCDGTTWAPVENSPMSLSAGTPSLAKSVSTPTCTYRSNVTACSGCSVTVLYACAQM